MLQQKTFVLHGPAQDDVTLALNRLLADGWKVKEVHPNQTEKYAFWLVVAEQRLPGKGASAEDDGDNE